MEARKLFMTRAGGRCVQDRVVEVRMPRAAEAGIQTQVPTSLKDPSTPSEHGRTPPLKDNRAEPLGARPWFQVKRSTLWALGLDPPHGMVEQ